jgi:hypothetical protein
MSVSQVKKRFEELAAYLNKDTEGQRLLKNLKDSVNVLRTNLASASEEKTNAEWVKDQARQRADKADEVMLDMAAEMKVLQDTVRQQKAQIDQLLSDIDKATDPHEDPRQFKENTPARLLADLIRVLPKCPRVKFNTPYNGTVLQMPLDIIVGDFSYQRLWSLGATVALMAVMGKKVLLEHRGASCHQGNENDFEELGPGFRNFVFKSDKSILMFKKWFSQNIYDDSDHTLQENIQFEFNRRVSRTVRQPYTKGALTSGIDAMLPRDDE